MLRHSPPVAVATGRTPRARAAQPRRTLRGAATSQLPTPQPQPQPSAQTRRQPPSEALRPADVGLGHLFMHTRDAVIVGNVETGRIALWNPAAEHLFGYTPEEAIGQSIELLMPPPIAQLHTAGLGRLRRTGQSILLGSGTAIEVPALRKDGQTIRVELVLTPLEAPGSAPQYVMAQVRDVSDRKRAELLGLDAARAEAARSAAEQALAQRDELLSEATNELRRRVRQLAASTARLERSLARATAAPETERAVRRGRVVEQRAAALQRSVELMGDSTRVQAGTLEIQPQRLNLVPLVSRLVSEARVRCPLHRVRLAAPQGLTAFVDPLRIERVISLLLEAALGRNPRGGWVDVELRRPLVGLARLEVRDYGRPLGARQRARLDAAQALGWPAVCRAIVEAHGGAFSVEFPDDGGSRVVLILPTQHARVMGGAY